MNTLKRMHACVHTLVMYERQLVATTFPNDLFLRYVEHPVLVHEHVVQRHDQATQQKSRDEDGVYWPDVRELGAEERRQSEELVQHLVVWKDYFCCVVFCESSLIASRLRGGNRPKQKVIKIGVYMRGIGLGTTHYVFSGVDVHNIGTSDYLVWDCVDFLLGRGRLYIAEIDHLDHDYRVLVHPMALRTVIDPKLSYLWFLRFRSNGSNRVFQRNSS